MQSRSIPSPTLCWPLLPSAPPSPHKTNINRCRCRNRSRSRSRNRSRSRSRNRTGAGPALPNPRPCAHAESVATGARMHAVARSPATPRATAAASPIQTCMRACVSSFCALGSVHGSVRQGSVGPARAQKPSPGQHGQPLPMWAMLITTNHVVAGVCAVVRESKLPQVGRLDDALRGEPVLALVSK